MKLKKVWNIWRDAGVFEESKWREMGQCFSDSNIIDLSSDSAIHPTLQQAGITLGVSKPGVSYHRDMYFVPKHGTHLSLLSKLTERWGSASHAWIAGCHAIHIRRFTE